MMNKNIYLVLEYDYQYIYLPFVSLKDVDNYTVGFDNVLDLVATTGSILELGIPNNEIVDAYLSETIDQIADDTQEFSKRYLSIKYRHDDYNKLALENNFINYINYNLRKHALDEFNGLRYVYDNYLKAYVTNRELLDSDMSKIALLYLDNNYKRYKECYYILKDKNIKTKINEKHLIYNDENIKKMYEEDKEMLIRGTGLAISELQDYVSKQNKGRSK